MKKSNPFAFADLLYKAMSPIVPEEWVFKAKFMKIEQPDERDHENCKRKIHYPSRQHASAVVDRSNQQQGHRTGDARALHTYPCPSCYHGGHGVKWIVGHTPTAQVQAQSKKPKELETVH